jgi:putative sterol carrier protein
MSIVFPSKKWMDELLKKINSDEQYRKVAATWEGDYLLTVLLDEEALKDFQDPEKMAGLISMLKTLPPDKWAKFKGRPEEKLFEKLGLKLDEIVRDPSVLDRVDVNELAKKMASIRLEEIRGAALYLWMDFWHGEFRRFEVVAPGEKMEAKFKLTGNYSLYKQIVQGKVEVIPLVISGKLKLHGDLGYMLRNMAAVKRFSELLASIPVK